MSLVTVEIGIRTVCKCSSWVALRFTSFASAKHRACRQLGGRHGSVVGPQGLLHSADDISRFERSSVPLRSRAMSRSYGW